MRADASSAAVLRGEGLTRRFRQGEEALTVFENLNLELKAGDRVALTGESGAGKSTLLYLLGLLDTPTSGRVWLSGVDTSTLDEPRRADARNQQIGFVWQMSTLLDGFTALENAMMPLLIRGVPQREARQAAREALEETGLGARLTHRPGELSGGEQQRAVLARALAARPKLLLADEPTGNLDEATGERIIELIERLHEERGLTTLYVTHNPGFSRRASRIIELRQGALIERPGAV
ncbi:MAG: ABC transporter ATP-binding protein [Bryobacteraceae bacterium]|nr:ABC transporter ATP-binding protein [Bryobacteraceae bacterium]